MNNRYRAMEHARTRASVDWPDHHNDDGHQYNYQTGNDDDSHGDPSKDSSRRVNHHDHECGPSKTSPASYAGFANTDKEAVYAKKIWGVHPGVLVNAAKALGIPKVRELIRMVRTLPDWRFDRKDGQPVEAARGAYLRACFMNECLSSGRQYGRADNA